MLLQLQVLVDTLRGSLMQFGAYLPRLLGALLILVVGWIVARWIRTGVSKLLVAVRFDEVSKKSGIDEVLQQGGVRLTLNGVISGLIYWLVMLVALLASIDSLGLAVASDVLNRVVLYLPNVVIAVVILILGALFANLIRGIVGTYLANAQVSGARIISAIAHYAVLVFAAAVALVQLGIGRELVTSAFQIAFGAVCLALALAFGLGGRDWAARMIDKATRKQ
ncbi:MAG TPA: hypothetical protein VJL31_08440 [Gemmatimonadales bacterium]|nr:hypothetical protein [Gemmatimonadales bacterium]